MKIPLRSVPSSGTFDLEEKFEIDKLDLGSAICAPCEPVVVEAHASKGINSITVRVLIKGAMQFSCSRCLNSFRWPFEKTLKFHYEVAPRDLFIMLDPDLREEIILDFPVKPLCKPDCLGLCVKCGEDLNAGKCKCK